jgi:hypothetical protein
VRSLLLIAMLGGIAGADEPQDSIRYGEQLLKDGQLWRARWAFEKARSFAPFDARIHRLLGIVNYEIGDIHAAVLELESARQIAPNDPRSIELASQIRELRLQYEHDRRRQAVGLLAGGLVLLAAGGAILGGGIALWQQHNGTGQGGGPDVLAAEIALDLIGIVAEAAGLALSIAGGVQLWRHPLVVAPSVSSRSGGMQLSLGF